MTTHTTHKPATALTPMQRFYDMPTPSHAIQLALADSFAYCAPMMPDSDYVKQLRRALERNDAYPRLAEALHALFKSQEMGNTPTEIEARRAARVNARALLRELGES